MGMLFTEPMPSTGLPAGAYARIERYEVGRSASGPQDLHVTVALYGSHPARVAGAPPLLRRPYVWSQDAQDGSGGDEGRFDDIHVVEIYELLHLVPDFAGTVSDDAAAPASA